MPILANGSGNFIGEVSLQNFLLFIFVVMLTFIAANIVSRLLQKALREKFSPIVLKSLSKISTYTIYFLGFYFAFQKILDFNITAFLAALGILGITLLLTMLPILQNFFAGLVISVERPFKEEDIVEIDGIIGIVKDITLIKTVIRSLDGKLLIVPNMRFVTGNVANYSKGEFIRIDLGIMVRNDANYRKAIEIINKILHENPNVLPNVPKRELSIIEKFFVMPKNPKVLEPLIFIKNADKDKITLQVWFWIWDILKNEKIVSDFYEKLMLEFKNDRVYFG